MALRSRSSRFWMQQVSGFSEALYRSGKGVCEAPRTVEAGDDDLPRVSKEDGVNSPQWIFLGIPGVGKGTNASRMARRFNVPHISMGEIVRDEVKSAPAEVKKLLLESVTRGKLLPDDMIIELLNKRLRKEMALRGRGFILDGFPRTIHQAEMLEGVADIDLVVNLKMREDVIVAKCLGRRICSECGEYFNLANIDVGGKDGEPRTTLPPRLPPSECVEKMTIRVDDVAEVIRDRLRIYHAESEPVEKFYQMKGKLLNFNVGEGIAKTSNSLLAALNLWEKKRQLMLSNAKVLGFPSLPPSGGRGPSSDHPSNPA